MNKNSASVCWLRWGLPPVWILVATLAILVFVRGLYHFTTGLDFEEGAGVIRRVGSAMVVIAAAAYGLFRGFAFHPVFHDEYLAWLSRTPWRYPQPLPLGPTTCGLADVGLLGSLAILTVPGIPEVWIWIPTSFAIVLLGCWTVSLWLTDLRIAAYQVTFGLATAVWIYSVSIIAGVIVLVATYVFAHRQLGRSMSQFPWAAHQNVVKNRQQRKRELQSPNAAYADTMRWGWAYDALSPRQLETLPRFDRVCLSLVTGWSAFALITHAPDEVEPVMMLIWFSVNLVVAVGFILRYLWSHAAPISLMGRLATRRWLIPSYDVVFVPIILLVISGVVTCLLVQTRFERSLRQMWPACITLAWVVIHLTMPELNQWRLTCRTRLSPSSYASNKGDFEQL